VVVVKGNGGVHLFEEKCAGAICIERQIVAARAAQEQMIARDRGQSGKEVVALPLHGRINVCAFELNAD
jgi:hypothetical protein